MAKLHELVVRHGDQDLGAADAIVGIETDCGTWVQALLAAGYRVYAINPREVVRSRQEPTGPAETQANG